MDTVASDFDPSKTTLTEEFKPPQKHSWLWVGIITLLLALLGVVSYLIIQNQSLQRNLTQTETNSTNEQTPRPSEVPLSGTEEATANWKTYTNKQYNYSIKIPPEWEYTEENNQNPSKISKGNVSKTTLFSTENTKTITIYFEGDWDHSFEPEVPVLNTNTPLDNKTTQLTVLQGNKNMDPFGGDAIYTIPNFHDFRIETSYYPDISQILSTFKFTETQVKLPAGWTSKSIPSCNVNLPIPPAIKDTDNRTWEYTTDNQNLYGYLKGESHILMHRNPEEASGYISGMVNVSCGKSQFANAEQLLTGLSEYLQSEAAKYADGDEFIIKISSIKDVNKWDVPVKELAFTGGMSNPNQKYYLFIKNGQWYLITSRSDSSSQAIQDQTSSILSNLTFTN